MWSTICISGSTAAIAIVSATPVGKWENPGVSLGTPSMDPSVAVVVPSVGEKSELQDNMVDVVEPLVSSTPSMLGSPAIDNKLRLTSSVDNASAAVAIAKVLTLSAPTSRVVKHGGGVFPWGNFSVPARGNIPVGNAMVTVDLTIW